MLSTLMPSFGSGASAVSSRGACKSAAAPIPSFGTASAIGSDGLSAGRPARSRFGSGTTSTFKCYNDQSIVSFFADKCEGINAKLAKGEDQKICEVLFPVAVTSYANGSADMNTAVSNFKASVHDMYSYLKVG